uniref:Uncharacterized protein n=1 Tax=Caenorhabditis japonica TaxID=281687 RepID=A0A8R1EJF9_CAEJA
MRVFALFHIGLVNIQSEAYFSIHLDQLLNNLACRPGVAGDQNDVVGESQVLEVFAIASYFGQLVVSFQMLPCQLVEDALQRFRLSNIACGSTLSKALWL